MIGLAGRLSDAPASGVRRPVLLGSHALRSHGAGEIHAALVVRQPHGRDEDEDRDALADEDASEEPPFPLALVADDGPLSCARVVAGAAHPSTLTRPLANSRHVDRPAESLWTGMKTLISRMFAAF